MRAYIMITGTIFAFITVAHLWRVYVEGSHLAVDPLFVLLTVIAAVLSGWAVRLVRRSPGAPE